MHFTKKKNLTFLWFGLGFALVASFMFIFYQNVNTELEATEVANISLTANQQQATINGTIASQAANLESMSKTLVIMGDNQNAIASYLGNLEKNLGIDTVIYTDSSGIGIRSNFKEVDVVDNEAFQGALQGHLTVTAPYQSKFTGQDVIAAAMPVQEKDTIIGTVIVEYDLEFIKKTLVGLVDEADDSGYTIMVDNQGDVVVTTSYKNEYFIPFHNAIFEGGIQYEDIIRDLARRVPEGGGAIATIGTEKRIIEYRPINLKTWSIIVVSEDVSNTLIRHISQGIGYLLWAIVIFFLFFLTGTFYLKRKGIKDIEAIAFYDELTGLPNLVYFKEHVKELIKAYPDMAFTMQKMDIKNFKIINEMFGHDVGDHVLKKLAETIKSIEEPTFTCARVGADKFIMFSGNGFLSQDDISREQYEASFKALLPELAEHEFVFRYGRYFLEPGEDNVMDIINKTNMAHHMAKVHDDKRTYEYDDAFKKRLLRLAQINNKRKNAIDNKEFRVFLQPKINIFENKICGAEALVRWIEQDGKMVYPDEFIPLFEKNGFIVHLDNYILRGVCRQIKIWLQAGYKVVPISVNFSRMHLQNPRFVQELKATCDSYGNIRQYIEVELTESAATENGDDLAIVLRELHEAGFSVAIDDFGAGYSSLGMLKTFTVDALKLDKSFFDENKGDSRGDIVVRGIIQVAKALGMKIVAEGIETAEQIKFLKSIQCEIVQGYYYAKPMPLPEFEQAYMGEYDENAQ